MLIPLIVVGAANIVLTSNIFTKQLEQSSDIILSRTATEIEQIYREFETAERLFVRDEDFVSTFETSDIPIVKQVEAANQLQQYVTKVQYINSGFRVSVIVNRPHYLTKYGLPVRSDWALLRALEPSGGEFKRVFVIREDSSGRTFNWLAPFGDVVRHELYGCLEIQIPYNTFVKIMAEPLKVGQVQYLATDKESRTIIPANGASAGTLIKPGLIAAIRQSESFPYHDTSNSDNSYFMRKIGDEWMLIGEIPRKQILSPLNKVNQWTIGIILSQIALTSLLAAGLARNFSRPIQRLASLVMRKKNEGADIYIPQIARRDEIRELYDGIRELLMEIRHEQIQKREYQLRLLQYQINPHFLYNSLDTIQWKAFEHRDRDLTDMIRNLSYFLRSGLNQADIVSVRDELMHLNSYIALQNIRYEGQFTISVSVDDGLMDQQITKISLQPLVENSIMHAMNRHSGGTRIEIRGKRTSADTFVLSVFDDGQALDLERVIRILEKRNPDPASFGIRNVHERIQLYFGDSYGLSVRKTDSGTSFDIKLPYYGPGTQFPSVNQ
ncbi:histidine kinase [Paenibacillus sp. sptzw28]|uniref:sensor histidine kinase n=1 Tax=Paenibacillus sp. sptzw28 TaxID=715179 RepID=UPI001C6F2C53|nr:histidine kinase [Paenibacillus sp. sptzw28]QYR23754.1 histidine kinase [Paenibacillus sp. sptzw28]